MGISPDILDVEALRRNFGDDFDFAGQLASKFRIRYPSQVASIAQALAAGDAAAAADAAHKLAGETSVFYAVAARRAALHIEELARAGDVDAAALGCDALRAELGRLTAALNELAGHQ